MIKEIWNDFRLGKKENGWIILGLAFVAFVLFIMLIFYATPVVSHYFLDKEAIKEGTTIGGSVGAFSNGVLIPFISSIAVVTTFLAFIVQYRANKRLTKDSKRQRRDIKRERAQTKFYELLRLHKSNVNEIKIRVDEREEVGREAFILIYEQLKKAYQAASSHYGGRKIDITDKRQVSGKGASFQQKRAESFISMAYFLCFFGYSSCRSFNEKRYPRGVKPKHFKGFLDYLEEQDDLATSSLPPLYQRADQKYPGDVSKIGHYYRHLYQMVKFVVTENDLVVNSDDPAKREVEQYQYIKIIRAQLSNHEQALIYYNSFFSRVWWGEEEDSEGKPLIENQFGQSLSYFLDFAFIKNLPGNLTDDMGPIPEVLFRQRLEEREYSPDYKGVAPEMTIDQKLDWLFEWKGG